MARSSCATCSPYWQGVRSVTWARSSLESPFPIEDWTYCVGTRLAVVYVDALPEALSAIYCYYDPTEGALSLGTSNLTP
jgi:arginyl-tRNA--protein-N-Asp/Glu arginylyltransferase